MCAEQVVVSCHGLTTLEPHGRLPPSSGLRPSVPFSSLALQRDPPQPPLPPPYPLSFLSKACRPLAPSVCQADVRHPQHTTSGRQNGQLCSRCDSGEAHSRYSAQSADG